MSVDVVVAAIAVGCTVVGALAVLAYHSGRLSVRVEQLEQWRIEMRSDTAEMRRALHELKECIVNGGSR